MFCRFLIISVRNSWLDVLCWSTYNEHAPENYYLTFNALSQNNWWETKEHTPRTLWTDKTRARALATVIKMEISAPYQFSTFQLTTRHHHDLQHRSLSPRPIIPAFPPRQPRWHPRHLDRIWPLLLHPLPTFRFRKRISSWMAIWCRALTVQPRSVEDFDGGPTSVWWCHGRVAL